MPGRGRVFQAAPSSSLSATNAPSPLGPDVLRPNRSATKKSRPDARRITLGRCPLPSGWNGVLCCWYVFPPSVETHNRMKPTMAGVFPTPRGTDRHRHEAIDGGVLAAEADQRAILADHHGGVPAAGAAHGIEPS